MLFNSLSPLPPFQCCTTRTDVNIIIDGAHDAAAYVGEASVVNIEMGGAGGGAGEECVQKLPACLQPPSSTLTKRGAGGGQAEDMFPLQFISLMRWHASRNSTYACCSHAIAPHTSEEQLRRQNLQIKADKEQRKQHHILGASSSESLPTLFAFPDYLSRVWSTNVQNSGNICRQTCSCLFYAKAQSPCQIDSTEFLGPIPYSVKLS